MSLLQKIKEIQSGWLNLLYKKVTIEEIAKIRQDICRMNECGFYMTSPIRGCGECGCPEKAKIRSLHSKCPEDLWGYAYELKLELTEQLLSDLSGMKKRKQDDGLIVFSRRDVKILWDEKTKSAWLSKFPTERVQYWNDLWTLYNKETGKKLF